MNFTVNLGSDDLKLYYNSKVYDPHYSSIELAMVANTFIFGKIKYLDIATGCGFTGLILKKIHPYLDVTLSDIDPEAVRIAKLNAKRLGLDVSVVKADLIPPGNYHVITANLPTFDALQMAQEALHGPETAYYGGKDGLELYTRLFKEAKSKCVVLACEVQQKHQAAFLSLANLNGWTVIEQSGTAFAMITSERDMEGLLREIQASKLASAK